MVVLQKVNDDILKITNVYFTYLFCRKLLIGI